MTHYQYPPSDTISFHSPAYDTGFFSTDGPLCSPLEDQHQHSLVPVPSSYLHYDDCLPHYEHYAQPPIPPVHPSSSSSELGHALVETPPPESRPIGLGAIALPSLAMPSPKHDPSDTLVGLNPIKTEYASGVNGQPYSPMASLSTLPLASELVPHPKEEAQEQVHVFPAPVVPHGNLHHRQHTRDSFRLVQDPAAYPVFTPPSASKVCSPPHVCPMSFMLTSRGSDILLHLPSRYRGRYLILLAHASRRRFPRRSRHPILGRRHRA